MDRRQSFLNSYKSTQIPHETVMLDKRNSGAVTDTDTSGSDASLEQTLPPTSSSSRMPLYEDDAMTQRMTMTPSPYSPRSTIERMRNVVLDAATHSVDSVRREARHAFRDPRQRLRNVRRLNLRDTPHGIGLYECEKARTGTTRVLGLSQVRAPIHEVVAALSHKSPLSLSLLHPGLAQATTLHTLVDKPTEFVAVKSLTMQSQWNAPHLTHARSFIVIETQQAFRTSDGRRGWVVTFHSLSWPTCPGPPRDVVRASVYNTGMVALERRRKVDLIDLYSVAEFKLKGEAGGGADWTAAKDRVLDTLVLLTGTVKQRTVSNIAPRETLPFDNGIIDRATAVGSCSLCHEPQETCPCGRCRSNVCPNCSSSWRQDERLCRDCWGTTTLNF